MLMAAKQRSNPKGRPPKGIKYNKLAAGVRIIVISARELPPVKGDKITYYLTSASLNKRASNSKI